MQLTAEQIEHNRRLEVLQSAASAEVVDPSDGISESEAYRIAYDAMGVFCGLIDVPEDCGESWRVPVMEGILPGHSRDIVISKSDGSYVTRKVRPIPPNQANPPSKTAVAPSPRK